MSCMLEIRVEIGRGVSQVSSSCMYLAIIVASKRVILRYCYAISYLVLSGSHDEVLSKSAKSCFSRDFTTSAMPRKYHDK